MSQTKSKGVNEAYRGQALDKWKINMCCQTSCNECKYHPWDFDKELDCGGRYAV